MATTPSSSSLRQQTSPHLPVNGQLLTALPAPPQPLSATPTTNPRRLPPPCWSHDETVALIDAYRDKWYSLRRGNLKADHWQEVAEAVARRCPIASPPKTSVQCRHKMEKLRKRYRTEIQRARSMPVSRFSSSWVLFKRMDAMEKGPSAKRTYNSGSDDDDDSDRDDNGNQDFYEDGLFNNSGNRVSDNMRSVNKMYRSNAVVAGSGSGAADGLFRFRIPTVVSIAQPAPSKFYAKIENTYSPIPNPSVINNSNPNSKLGLGARVYREIDDKARKRERGKEEEEVEEKEPVAEMVAAIKMLGDGFVRMEQMKMEMAREIETMRMEMEMKRTEMILESQQRIVEAFAKAMSDNKKKAKRMPSRES